MFATAGVAIVGFGASVIALDVRSTHTRQERDAPKCRAVYGQIAAAQDDVTY